MSGRPIRLISVLGKGPDKSPPPHYEPVVYRAPDETPLGAATPLVQAALSRWLSPASMHLLATAGAKKRWEGKLLDEYLPVGAAPRAFCDIPDGSTNDQQWRVFEVVVALLEEAREAAQDVVVDVTHGFRSLPLIVVSAVSFARARWRMQTTLDTRAELPDVRIVYGAYDRDVEGDTHIWDLTGILGAADWADALRAFLSFGRADDLESMARGEAKLMPGEGVRPEQVGAVGNLGKLARVAANDLATARAWTLLGTSLPNVVKSVDGPRAEWFKTNRPALHETLSAFAKGLGKMSASTRLDTREGLDASVELARLLGRMERYSEQAAVVRETAVTFFGLEAGLPTSFDKNGKVADNDVRKQADDLFKDLVRKGRANDATESQKLAAAISSVRNDIEHAGFNKDARDARDVRNAIAACVDGLAREIEAWDGLPHPPQPRAALFLNLSNHPITTWPEAQRIAAEQIGPLAELPDGLPLIDPDLSTKEVEARAKEIAKQALTQNPTAAAVFGEPVFSALLVHELEDAGVACYAPAGRRAVLSERIQDGTVHVERSFAFHAWRMYRTQ